MWKAVIVVHFHTDKWENLYAGGMAANELVIDPICIEIRYTQLWLDEDIEVADEADGEELLWLGWVYVR